MRNITVSLPLVVALLLSSPATAQEFRTVSLFSPLNVQTVIDNLKKSNVTTNQKLLNLQSSFDLNVAANIQHTSPTSSETMQSLVKRPPGVIRTNILSQNTAQFDQVLGAADADSNIRPILDMHLFDDVDLKVVVSSTRKLPDGTTAISGEVEGSPGTSAIFTKNGDQLFGTVRTYDAIYNLSPLSSTPLSPSTVGDVLPNADRATVVNQISTSFKPEAEPTAPTIMKKDTQNDANVNLALGDDPSKPDPAPTINIAVFYTQAAVNGAGSVEALSALAKNSVETIRQSFLRSQIKLNANLIFSGLVNYTETGDIQKDRDRLQNPNDGFMDDVPPKRDEVKADVVALIIENGGIFCGISFIPEDPSISYSDFAYMVIARTCAVDNLSFAHEFGHILGARHDRYVDSTQNKPVPDDHGLFFKCGNATCRDIMAYNNYCQDRLVTSCVRQGVWSGKVWDLGAAVPIDGTDVNDNNQRVLRLYGPIVAGYRSN